MSILDRIVEQRRMRIAREGRSQGLALPQKRRAPLTAFGRPPFVVCEIKRRSPSRGDIAPALDPVDQAGRYAQRGVASISVLTEQDSFAGSLADLAAIKEALPHLSLLRKDFLLDEEDVEVSWRAGADAVLLIAALLDGATVERMHGRARALGMEALVEVHDRQDVEKCRGFAPPLVGINCRDLSTFAVDLLHPVGLRPGIDWPARLVFESGVRGPEDVLMARSAGFDGVLVGETAMRRPERIADLVAAASHDGAPVAGSVAAVPRVDAPQAGFWPRLCGRRRPGRPLVKICGITRAADAVFAADHGADVLGFVFAPSPRRANPGLLRDLCGLGVAKVAVVVAPCGGGERDSSGAPRLDPEVAELIAAGSIDAVQLHGAEAPEECAGIAFPYYKAVRVRDERDIDAMGGYFCPRVLADAYSPGAAGGTGKRVPLELAREIGRRRPLWLAGGIDPTNVGQILRELRPELIDASSGLEESPGRKDRGKLEVFFKEIRRHANE